jgi:hypothetical protein
LRGSDTEPGTRETCSLTLLGRGFLRFRANFPAKGVQKSTSAHRLHFRVHCIHFDQSKLQFGFWDRAAMVDKAFFQSGNTPTLLAAFFYFDMSFMVWVMLGPLGPLIGTDLHLDNAQKGLWSRCRCSPAR